LRRQQLGQPYVVGVEKREDLAACGRNGRVAGDAGTGVVLPDVRNVFKVIGDRPLNFSVSGEPSLTTITSYSLNF
jgi:hypothetical protein